MSQRVEKAVEILKSTGVRMTPQRHAILSYLLDSMSHPTADEIYKALEGKFPNMSVATVYNNLRVFKEAGLVRELTYGDASSRFDANVEEDHYHAICTKCGAIRDFHFPYLQDVEEAAAESVGFRVTGHRMEIYGVCEECQKKSH
ncbi:peroxide-responsive transcriptional repressor PerR [Brevibacillus sp. MCWH]|jgi:Fur family transcriptional regulator, peroxide stress response regulator|uniref:peroxide-responsive transcriptional repressor PerR n=1 Tax=Brevibacillus sp. MCWH TaxID=2508871 RepID=UPI0014929EDE|nr:peroxide-responsive transcriptional repressor PerR [Brevibacillus sp. MCWH]NNV02186.1 peroxide-responsive transcriptional repressor PerR [Brevibacillus sp. MCWH]